MNTQFEEKLITCEPSYIKWTQWVFSRLKEKGLAYKAYGQVNYCPSCETVLANEQVKQGKCDRCSSLVESKTLNQWYFKITDYRDRLIKNLEWINYPSGTKKQQRVWLENLRDWCVSRQRKWGCPIPVEGETDTLDTFVDSSFYYLRYLTNSETEFLPKGAYKPIDLYVGGNEHACMHLIYARFIHMFLYDLGIVPQEEPFNRVIHQGMITCDGSKMSKSKGNAVNPDDFNPDELRMFLMFLGHYFDGGDWDGEKIVGISRFLERMRKWLRNVGTDHIPLEQFENTIDSYVSAFKFNKVISEWMIFYNQNKEKTPTPATCDKLVTILKVFAPGFES